MFAFQGLHTGHFIQALRPFALLGQFWRLTIACVDVRGFGFELLIVLGRQPVAVQMGLDVRIFLKASPHVGARFVQQSLAG